MEGDGKQGEVGRGALYRVAYDEAVRALSEQLMALDRVRSHTGLLLSAAVVTTSFLGAQALNGTGLNLAAWMALGSFVGLALISLAILMPRRWEFSVNPHEVIRKYVEADAAAPIEDLHRDLSLYMHRSYVKNWEGLNWLATLMQAFSIALTAEVIFWVIAIASTG